MKVIVTGAAGYIGSHTLIDLIQQGYKVVGIDNYSNSSEKVYERVEELTNKSFKYYQVDLRDLDELDDVFQDHDDARAIIHFAALKSVDESTTKPQEYYDNNVGGLIHLIQLQKKYRIPYFIFSSSCTVYGNAETLPVTESTPLQPAQSPYGLTKQIGEMLLEDFIKYQSSLSCVSLRYFNPAGAHPSGRLGEAATQVVRNLIPLIMEVGSGYRQVLEVYGNNYPTRDGTNIRDFIHIMDLARAHTLALDFLIKRPLGTYEVFNLGTGKGVSIIEAIESFNKVSNTHLPVKFVPRRPGDVIAVYADYQKAKNLLNWEPQYTLDDIMSHAWEWETNKQDFLN